MREKLSKLIKESKKYAGNALIYSDIDDIIDTSSEDLQAEYLLKNNVIVLPCKVGDIIDTIISHNSIVVVWREIDDYGTSELLWRGMAWNIPEEYKKLKFKRIFGTVPESITEADSINILADEGNETE